MVIERRRHVPRANHPGGIILDSILNKAAKGLGMNVRDLEELISGLKDIDREIAHRLATYLKTSVGLREGLQADYDTYLEGKKKSDK